MLQVFIWYIFIIIFSKHFNESQSFNAPENPKEMLKFMLGHGIVMKGLVEGIYGMCEGEKRRLVVPPSLTEDNQAIVFDVEMASIQQEHQIVAQHL